MISTCFLTSLSLIVMFSIVALSYQVQQWDFMLVKQLVFSFSEKKKA